MKTINLLKQVVLIFSMLLLVSCSTDNDEVIDQIEDMTDGNGDSQSGGGQNGDGENGGGQNGGDHDHGDGQNGGDHDHGDGQNGDGNVDLISENTTVFTKDETDQVAVTTFNTAIDMINLGTQSIHNQIPVDTPEGIKFENLHNDNFLLIKGVNLHDLRTENFFPIIDAHLQQDLSAALAWENGKAFVRPNTIYIRSHEENKVETVDFNTTTDKINFMYLSVRGDDQTNFSVEQTTSGVRFFSAVTGQSITLRNVKFSDLKNEHFEWRANQLEDNIATRMGLDTKITGFTIVQANVFNGKSIANAGGVDQAPYHQYNYPEYTGTPRSQTSSFEN